MEFGNNVFGKVDIPFDNYILPSWDGGTLLLHVMQVSRSASNNLCIVLASLYSFDFQQVLF